MSILTSRGVMIAAVLSAIMSTADSQLLVAASSITHDLEIGRDGPWSLLSRSRVVVLFLSVGAVGAAPVRQPGDLLTGPVRVGSRRQCLRAADSADSLAPSAVSTRNPRRYDHRFSPERRSVLLARQQLEGCPRTYRAVGPLPSCSPSALVESTGAGTVIDDL